MSLNGSEVSLAKDFHSQRNVKTGLGRAYTLLTHSRYSSAKKSINIFL